MLTWPGPQLLTLKLVNNDRLSTSYTPFAQNWEPNQIEYYLDWLTLLPNNLLPSNLMAACFRYPLKHINFWLNLMTYKEFTL